MEYHFFFFLHIIETLNDWKDSVKQVLLGKNGSGVRGRLLYGFRIPCVTGVDWGGKPSERTIRLLWVGGISIVATGHQMLGLRWCDMRWAVHLHGRLRVGSGITRGYSSRASFAHLWARQKPLSSDEGSPLRGES